MQSDFNIVGRAEFAPELLWGDFEKWLTASVWDGRKYWAERSATPKPNGQSPTLSERQKWLASVSRQFSSPNYSPTSSFSSNLSFFSDSPAASFSSSISTTIPTPLHFSNEYFAVRPSPKGGLGAVAIRDIPKETIIIAEKPLFQANCMDVVRWRYEALSREKKQAYHSLHHWVGVDRDEIFGIYKTNRFELGGTAGILLTCSRFNHACHPYATCTYQWDKTEEQMKVSTLKNIAEGEELTISYMGHSVDRAMLNENYGFECNCLGCLEKITAAEEVKKLTDTGVPLRSRHKFA